MPIGRAPLDLGRRVYGLAAVALGIIGLVWGDFAAVWQPVDADFPHRRTLAYLVAVCLLPAGIAVQWRRPAKVGLPVLALVHLVFALRWLRRVIAFPLIIGTWLGSAEQLALVVAGVMAFAALAREGTAWAAHVIRVCRALFGLCAVVFGLAHFLALKDTMDMVPAWIPPGQRFWAVTTGIAHLLAGLAIVSGLQARLAARLLTAMLITFGALVWAPMLAGSPGTHFMWAGNAINLAVAGAAWVVADATGSPAGCSALDVRPLIAALRGMRATTTSTSGR